MLYFRFPLRQRIAFMDETNDLSSEVQELVWAMLDEQATDDQLHRLERLLVEDPEARRIYVMCMQMHADLHHLFRDSVPRLPPAVEKAMKSQKAAESKTPLPLIDLPPTSAGAPTADGVA
jgi:hypothetical protein